MERGAKLSPLLVPTYKVRPEVPDVLVEMLVSSITLKFPDKAVVACSENTIVVDEPMFTASPNAVVSM